MGEQRRAQVVDHALAGELRHVGLRHAQPVERGQGDREERGDVPETDPVAREDIVVDGQLDEIGLEQLERRGEGKIASDRAISPRWGRAVAQMRRISRAS